jgi:hypothetical protein
MNGNSPASALVPPTIFMLIPGRRIAGRAATMTAPGIMAEAAAKNFILIKL